MIKIKNFHTTNEMAQAFTLMQQIYPKMTFDDYIENLENMIAMNNFKMIGVFSHDKLIGASGYWILQMLYCGKYLQVSSFVVDENFRSQGIGREILHHLKNLAREHNCDKIVLDSYTENKKSHSLYFGENFYIRGFHFMKDLG